MASEKPFAGPLPPRVDVLGSEISAVDMGAALECLELRMASRKGGYVCFTNVHAVIMGQQTEAFRNITNMSFLSLADGKPVYWAARRQAAVGHVPGPDFMLEALRRFHERRHFFYGSTPEVLITLGARLRETVPGLNICGCLSPPFRVLTADELEEHFEFIRSSKADIVWVGLGAPKQEQWMARAAEELAPSVLLGVGAAFDFHANRVRRAPPVVRAMGLEWLFRLASQPRRLWRRYLVTNSLFVFHIMARLASRSRS